MIELHPEIVLKDERRFVIWPYEEFAAIQEPLVDAEDLAALRAAKKESMTQARFLSSMRWTISASLDEKQARRVAQT